jgi:mannosyltransferase
MEAPNGVAASGKPERTQAGSASPSRSKIAPGLAIAAILALGAGSALRLHSSSPLWLDEALSVNIAHLPLPDLVRALRRDGSPPLYYIALHYWIAIFGSSDDAVRALSTVFAFAAMPVAYLVARRAGGRGAGLLAMLLLGSCPFAVRYATETRMYSLVMLLSALWLLCLQRCQERPSPTRMAQVAVASGLLALTHYWTFFLMGAGALVLFAAIVLGGPRRRPATLSFVGLCLGAVLVIPWLPIMLFQLQHTGTPWAQPPGPEAIAQTLTAWTGLPRGSLPWWCVVLALLAVSARFAASRHQAPREEANSLWTAAWPLAALAFGTVAQGVIASHLFSSGFAPRYSAPAVVPAVGLAALGLSRMPRRVRAALTSVIVAAGLAASISGVRDDRRTQAARTAETIMAAWAPGDLVVYCPDQLGPAVSRLLPPNVRQVVYPTLLAPQLVDWVDYARRNQAASPADAAASISQDSRGAVWLVLSPGYRTFGTQCQRLDQYLTGLVGGRTVVQRVDNRYFERESVVRYSPVAD